MDIQERFSVVLKVSKVVKCSCIFVRSIRGLPNFLAIPIMNPLTRVHDILIYIHIQYIKHIYLITICNSVRYILNTTYINNYYKAPIKLS